MVETINDRVQTIIDTQFEGNKSAFAKAVGLSVAGMSSYLGKQRRSKFSVDMVTKIVTTLNVDARWLLTGESATSKVHTEGDYSPASDSGDVSVIVSDAVLAERVRLLEQIIREKDERIKEYKERIEELKHK